MQKDSKLGKPVVISFYCGDEYYYKAADVLRDDCRKYDVDFDIVEVIAREGETWLDICRKKIRFYSDMQKKHQRPVLWMDVDCRLNGKLDFLSGISADFGAFLRSFKYLRGFDPASLSRMFHPSILFFNYTPAGRAFLDLMVELEAESTASGTDDYFLQEAWLKHSEQLILLLLPPSTVSFQWPIENNEIFYFGNSGNVDKFKHDAQQHETVMLTPARRKAVLMREAGELGGKNKLDAALLMMQRALVLDPKDEGLVYRIARLLRRKGDMDGALTTLRKYQNTTPGVNHAKRFVVESEYEAGNFVRARDLAKDLARYGSPTDSAWARSRLIRYELEVRAMEQKISDEDRPALWWMETPYPGNFGDILNPYIVEKLSGLPPKWVKKGEGSLVIGSIIKFATTGTKVWGTGTPRMTDTLATDADYRAVRGPLTRELVLKSGGTCPEIYGDAAWFLPRLYSPKTLTPRYALGLIRHFANDADIKPGNGVKLISVIRGGYDDIEKFIDEIHQCDCVLTTSLHGLIVCHAYGIPARWCEVPDSATGLPGDGTKFADYMMSVGLEPEPPYHLPTGTVVTLGMSKEALRLPRHGIDLLALARVAPFPIRPEIMEALEATAKRTLPRAEEAVEQTPA